MALYRDPVAAVAPGPRSSRRPGQRRPPMPTMPPMPTEPPTPSMPPVPTDPAVPVEPPVPGHPSCQSNGTPQPTTKTRDRRKATARTNLAAVCMLTSKYCVMPPSRARVAPILRSRGSVSTFAMVLELVRLVRRRFVQIWSWHRGWPEPVSQEHATGGPGRRRRLEARVYLRVRILVAGVLD